MKNFMALLGMMRTQLVQLPFIMPRMPSVRAMCIRPCSTQGSQASKGSVAAQRARQPVGLGCVSELCLEQQLLRAWGQCHTGVPGLVWPIRVLP